MRSYVPPAAGRAAWPVANTVVAAVLILAGLALYLLRLDDVAGLIRDDAWYVVLAKAIAQGSGPRLISSAGPAMLSQVYPPGFPAILSLVFLVGPGFPDNVMLLKGVSIAAMIGAGVLTYRYAAQDRALPRSQALTVAVATVATPAFVFLATSTLMSEAVFLFVELAAVLLIGRTARAGDDRSGRAFAVMAGALAAAAFLIRTAGLTIGAAGVLYLARERQWRRVLWFGAVAGLSVMPWWLYARAHAPTQAQLVDHGGLMAVAYQDQFWTTEAGTVTTAQVGLDKLASRIARNVTDIAIRDMGGIFVPLLFRTSGESGTEVLGLGPPEGGKVPSMGSALGTKIVSLALTALAVLGFVSAWRRRVTVAEPLVVLALGMIVLWPFWPFRFVLPLVPFLFGYLVIGVETVARALGRVGRRMSPEPQAAARIFLFVLLGLNVLDHAQYIARAHEDPHGVPWKAADDNINTVLNWMQRNLRDEGAIATDNPALVYLRTGRRTVAIDSFDDKWARWRRMGVRYVLSLSIGEPLNDPLRATLRFKLPDRNVWIFELIPPDGSAGPPARGQTPGR